MSIFLTSLVACLINTITFGVLGSVVIWKKYVYFGDSLAHALFLAIVISSFNNVYSSYFIIFFSSIFALMINQVQGINRNLITAVIGQFFVALGILIDVYWNLNVNIETILFGDVLLINSSDIKILLFILFIVFLWGYFSLKEIILISISPDIAAVNSINIKKEELKFLLLLSLIISSTIKIFGVFMVTSLLLIPPMIAKIISNSPFSMIKNAVIIGFILDIVSVIVGFYADLPISPVMIIIGVVMLFILNLAKKHN